MKKKQLKTKVIPRFRTEDEERKFWATHDFTDYLDKFQKVKLDLSYLKPSTKSVTVRLPEMLLSDLRQLANKRDVPYQSLLKIFLAEKVEEETRSL